MSRYLRQTSLPEVGTVGQTKLAKAHAVVVGAGGLGAPVLQYLAGAGVGHITVIDGDTVSKSNLHRQTLFREAEIGRNKAVVSVETLRTLNPEIKYTSIERFLCCDSLETALTGADIVLDCADSFATSYILSDYCCAHALPLISGSVLGFTGYAGGFCAGAPSLRAVFPDLPTQMATCATAGVLGPVVGMIGSLQATLALNQLLGLSPSPLGQMLSLDARTYRTSGFRFDAAPEPKTPPLRFISQASIDADDILIDLRSAEEAPEVFHPSANRVLPEHISVSAPSFSKEKRIILACRSGLRAWQAARSLEKSGHQTFALIALGRPTPSHNNGKPS